MEVPTVDGLTFLVILAAPFALFTISNLYNAWSLDKIPTVGPSGVLSSYLGTYKYLRNARDVIQEGYDKYPGGAFKIAGIHKWIVVVSGTKMVEDLRKASDDQVSFRDAIAEALQIDYTLGPEIHNDPYHVAVIRSVLTRNLVERFPDVQDEIFHAFEEYIPFQEWTKVLALPTIMKIVCRTSNRLFVGLPLCRNPDYRSLNVDFTVDLVKTAQIINLFPNFLKPVAGRLSTTISSSIKRAMKHLEPIIQERIFQEERSGKKWPGKPNDYLTWLLDVAEGQQRTLKDLTIRVLAINFAAIHTTSMAFTQVLFDLATHPSHVPLLREEIEAVLQEEGLTKTSMYKLRKLDSFIKESQRLGGNGALVMQRTILKDFTFSDGTVIPKGTMVAVANFSMHRDEKNYSDPMTFDGFRFAEMADSEAERFSKQGMVSLANNYVVFGQGRHACPGRFFAVNELKALLAHVLMNYDVALEKDTVPPSNRWFGTSSVPDPTASVMFRKRRGT